MNNSNDDHMAGITRPIADHTHDQSDSAISISQSSSQGPKDTDDVVRSDSDRVEPVVQNYQITSISVDCISTIALWSWKESVENCAICREALLGICINCEAEVAHSTRDCRSVRGNCGHEFHFHCIYRWLTTNREECPLCSRSWPRNTTLERQN